MENKPIVTCHGNQKLFSSLHQTVVQGLPKEAVEWRRSYGRPPRQINVEANFVPFNPDILPHDDEWTLLGRPFFHTYWTDCDLDLYKTAEKEEISDWLGTMRSKNVYDWLIIVVVTDESRVKTKLLRQSVIDKVKGDFCTRQADRCIVLQEPFRQDSKGTESWSLLLARMRNLLLQAYNRYLNRFEENMRSQRERRTQKGWNFCQYFLLQEELAFMFEMLGLYEDALVQYDELDALFTQFVLNHAAGDTAEWLSMFQERPCNSWEGLCLSQPINVDKRHLIKHNSATLLDFRNYLFARQCTLLFLLLRPWEVAQRSIPFMHNLIKELEILELTLPTGAVACWIFLTSLEILNTCEKFSESGHMNAYSLHTASLWDYARNKLLTVGTLCGLLPEQQSSPSNLASLTQLLKGSHHEYRQHVEEGPSEALSKLKEALSSKEAFRKHYLELSELAMGTYKHIGRIRSARLIGKDLASFYMQSSEPQLAEGFLLDALKTYKQEGWHMLADYTRIDIATCQRTLENDRKYARSCLQLAASKVLDKETKLQYQQDLATVAQQISAESPAFMKATPAFKVTKVELESDTYSVGQSIKLQLTLQSNLPAPVSVNKVGVCLSDNNTNDKINQSFVSMDSHDMQTHSRESSMSSMSEVEQPATTPSPNPTTPVIDDEFRITSAAHVIVRSRFRRMDSCSSGYRDKDMKKEDFSLCVEVDDVDLQTGNNKLTLEGRIPCPGHYKLHQACVSWEGLEMLQYLEDMLSVHITGEDSSITVIPPDTKLISGISQPVTLQITPGYVDEGDAHQMKMLPVEGLSVTSQQSNEGDASVVPLPARGSDGNVECRLDALASLHTDVTQPKEYKVGLECSWCDNTQYVSVEFQHPLTVKHQIHTTGTRKFMQLLVCSCTPVPLVLTDHQLKTHSRDVELVSFAKQGSALTVSSRQSASYIWELKCNTKASPDLQCEFSAQCQWKDDEKSQPVPCKYEFTLCDYKTLYTVKTELDMDSVDGKCELGQSCKFNLWITKTDVTQELKDSLCYELNADRKHWALEGMHQGLLQLTDNTVHMIVEATPMAEGFLQVPQIKLSRVVGNAEEGDDIEDADSDYETETFHHGQVFNCSFSSQVQVHPALNQVTYV